MSATLLQPLPLAFGERSAKHGNLLRDFVNTFVKRKRKLERYYTYTDFFEVVERYCSFRDFLIDREVLQSEKQKERMQYLRSYATRIDSITYDYYGMQMYYEFWDGHKSQKELETVFSNLETYRRKLSTNKQRKERATNAPTKKELATILKTDQQKRKVLLQLFCSLQHSQLLIFALEAQGKFSQKCITEKFPNAVHPGQFSSEIANFLNNDANFKVKKMMPL